jgi:hypothetical protein
MACQPRLVITQRPLLPLNRHTIRLFMLAARPYPWHISHQVRQPRRTWEAYSRLGRSKDVCPGLEV